MEKTFTFVRKHIVTPYGIGGLLLLTILVGGLIVWLPNTTSAANAAAVYADAHWNCATAACTSRVPAGAAQPNEQCAEFVSRSLAAEGLVPGLTASSSQAAFGSYRAKNGKTYDLLWVGASSSGLTSLAGVYQYVTQTGVGKDIGKNLSAAVPGDVAIYFINDGHTAIKVAGSGSGSLFDAHNNARFHVPNEYSAYTILHMNAGGTVAPYWPTLQSGSTGNDVKSLQMMLNAHGAKLTVDGDFGPKTLAAVKAFQSSKKLSVDGVVGPQTWSAVIVTTKSGSTGTAVTALQQQLNAHGAKLTVNGTYGASTVTAVKNYQSSHKLTANGNAYLQTWESLLD
ncbi:MAG TPA: peptidoglycan-binding protein [Ktedonobacteraceae bacterium]